MFLPGRLDGDKSEVTRNCDLLFPDIACSVVVGLIQRFLTRRMGNHIGHHMKYRKSRLFVWLGAVCVLVTGISDAITGTHSQCLVQGATLTPIQW